MEPWLKFVSKIQDMRLKIYTDNINMFLCRIYSKHSSIFFLHARACGCRTVARSLAYRSVTRVCSI